MSLMIYRMDVKKMTLREAANQVVELVTEVWSKARIPFWRIPFWRKDYMITKVEKLHKEFRDIKRQKGRAGAQAKR